MPPNSHKGVLEDVRRCVRLLDLPEYIGINHAVMTLVNTIEE